MTSTFALNSAPEFGVLVVVMLENESMYVSPVSQRCCCPSHKVVRELVVVIKVMRLEQYRCAQALWFVEIASRESRDCAVRERGVRRP